MSNYLSPNSSHQGWGHPQSVTVDKSTGNIYVPNTGYSGEDGSLVKIGYSGHNQTMVYNDENGLELGDGVDGAVFEDHLGDVITDAVEDYDMNNTDTDTGHLCEVPLSGSAAQYSVNDTGSGDLLGSDENMAFYSSSGGDSASPLPKSGEDFLYAGAKASGFSALAPRPLSSASVESPTASFQREAGSIPLHFGFSPNQENPPHLGKGGNEATKLAPTVEGNSTDWMGSLDGEANSPELNLTVNR